MNIDDLTVRELKQIASLTKRLSGDDEISEETTLEEKRVIIVVDRGWIFAGDQSLTNDGYIKLTRAVHVFRWESFGFAKMIDNWKDSKVDLRNVSDVELPRDSVIFRIPVTKDWGLK